MDIKTEEGNLLSQAIGIGKFFLEAKKDYPLYLPSLTYIEKEPTDDDRKAAYIAAVEREEGTPEEMAAPENRIWLSLKTWSTRDASPRENNPAPTTPSTKALLY